MYNNTLRKFRVFLVFFLLFSLVLVNECNVKVFAASALTVSQTIDGNKVTFKVTDSNGLNNSVSILVFEKSTNSIAYMDQAVLINGEYTFKTVLPKGEYTGYVSASDSDKVAVEDIAIVHVASIVGFRDLNPVNVDKGKEFVLPASVTAILDDGTSREVEVQWMDVPGTDVGGQFIVTGKVAGSTLTVTLTVNIKDTSPDTNAAPTVIITSPNSGTSFSHEQDITITAQASDSDGTIAKVTFYNGDTKLAEFSSAPYSYTWKKVDKGSYTITATAADDDGAVSQTSVSFTVKDKHKGNGNPGGTVVTPSPTLVPTTTPAPSATPEPKPSHTPQPTPGSGNEAQHMKDTKGHWAEEGIKELADCGVIGGDPNGNFRPDDNITRGEFVKILVLALKLDSKDGRVFADTSNHWAKNYISTANSYGIVSGYSEAQFAPDEFITREQMASMIVKALKLSASSEGTAFTDDKEMSDWAKGAVAAAKEKGLIKGYIDGSFIPQGNASRAEAVTIILRAMKLIK